MPAVVEQMPVEDVGDPAQLVLQRAADRRGSDRGRGHRQPGTGHRRGDLASGLGQRPVEGERTAEGVRARERPGHRGSQIRTDSAPASALVEEPPGVRRLVPAQHAGFADKVTTELSLGGWGWHHEAGIHALRLILAGIFDELPDLQIISGHWGEMVPFYLPRLDDVLSPGDTGLSRTITDTYRSHVWVTPSGMYHRSQFDYVRDVVGIDRIIWSTDYPFLHLDGTQDFLGELDLSHGEREQVPHGNADRLLGLTTQRL